MPRDRSQARAVRPGRNARGTMAGSVWSVRQGLSPLSKAEEGTRLVLWELRAGKGESGVGPERLKHTTCLSHAIHPFFLPGGSPFRGLDPPHPAVLVQGHLHRHQHDRPGSGRRFLQFGPKSLRAADLQQNRCVDAKSATKRRAGSAIWTASQVPILSCQTA